MNAEVPIAVLAQHATEAAAMLKLLANDQRLLLLCRLCAGETAVGELIAHCALSPSGVSQHLAKLRDAGVVSTRRDGTTIYYSLANDDIRALIDMLCARFGPKA
jgi:DNA-binding transcriptional ArsR family regulator